MQKFKLTKFIFLIGGMDLEISDNMLIGFSLGPVDLDQDAQEFIKKLRNVGEKQPSEPVPPVRRLDK